MGVEKHHVILRCQYSCPYPIFMCIHFKNKIEDDVSPGSVCVWEGGESGESGESGKVESKETRLRNSHIKTEILLESLIFLWMVIGQNIHFSHQKYI